MGNFLNRHYSHKSMLLFQLLTAVSLVAGFLTDESSPWFAKIPNENLDGVPKAIVDMEKHYPVIKNILWNLIGRTGNSESTYRRNVKLKKVQEVVPPSSPFPCDVNNSRSQVRPTSVHEVRPGDIDVIGALGDSLSAANGAFGASMFEVDIENRGVSFSTGGQGNWRKFLTLANIIKEFNPNLVGYSYGDANSWERDAQFNVAHPGAMTQDLPFMVKELVKRVKNDRRVNYKNDWKLVTLMMGSNNFCLDFCYQKNARESVQMHRRNLEYTFDYLKQNMPRVIIILILSPHLRILKNLKGVSQYCLALKQFECPCLFGEQYKHKLNLYYELMDEWRQVEEEMVKYQKYREKDDFAIILVPFTKEAELPTVTDARTGAVINDFNFMSNDCFHFSQKGYALFANAIWNNMLEPDGLKSKNLPSNRFLCPSRTSPFIFTWKNSHVLRNET